MWLQSKLGLKRNHKKWNSWKESGNTITYLQYCAFGHMQLAGWMAEWCKSKHLNYAFNLHSHLYCNKTKRRHEFGLCVCVFFFSFYFFLQFFFVRSCCTFSSPFRLVFNSHFYLLSLKMNRFPRRKKQQQKKRKKNVLFEIISQPEWIMYMEKG